jgi:CheY-like chemotaxis protein
MLSILIVDDDAIKIKAIKAALLSVPDLREESIDISSDRIGAKRLLFEKQFDLLILDLSLPERFGNDPEPDGGAKFLEEINSDPEIIPPFHILGLTAFSDLKTKYSEKFSEQLWHLIIYETQYNNWQIQLNNYINYLIKSKAEIKDPSNIKYDYDLAIVTALYKVELEQILRLDANWVEYRVPNDHTIYYKGVFKDNGKKLRVIAAAADQMGLTATAIVCHRLIQNFRTQISNYGWHSCWNKDKRKFR